MFLSFSFDSLLSRGSRDVFTGFLTRSVQELWLIKGSAASGIASPKIWGDKTFDFRRINLFCVEKRLSKNKMTIFSKNFWGAWTLWPPGYAYVNGNCSGRRRCLRVKP